MRDSCIAVLTLVVLVLAVILTPVVLFGRLAVAFYYAGLYAENCEEYLSVYDENDSMLVTQDNSYIMTTKGFFYKTTDVIYATEEHIYAYKRTESPDSVIIKRADYYGKNEEQLYTFTGVADILFMNDENYLFIKDDDGRYYRYDFRTEELETITENEMPPESLAEPGYTNQFDKELVNYYSSLTLTRKSDGEQRTLTADRLKFYDDRYEIIKDIKGGIELAFVFYKGESIYIGGVLNSTSENDGFLLVYEYDFDNDDLSFFGWRGGIYGFRECGTLNIYIVPTTKEE